MSDNLTKSYKARFSCIQMTKLNVIYVLDIVIGKGQHGFCLVRQNHGNEMTLTTTVEVGFCIDPIEKAAKSFLSWSTNFIFGLPDNDVGFVKIDISKAKRDNTTNSEPYSYCCRCKQLNCVSGIYI